MPKFTVIQFDRYCAHNSTVVTVTADNAQAALFVGLNIGEDEPDVIANPEDYDLKLTQGYHVWGCDGEERIYVVIETRL